MLILAIDSSQQTQSLAVFDDTKQSFIVENTQVNKSSQLMPALVSGFEQAKIKPQDIGLLACSVGPGSFTGIRTAITIIKTLAAELNLQIFAVNNFQLLRFANQLSNNNALAMPAGKNDYFISLDTNYSDTQTNFFSAELLEHKVYRLEDFQSAKLIIEMYLKTEQKTTINYKDLQPYYLREPSINTPKS